MKWLYPSYANKMQRKKYDIHFSHPLKHSLTQLGSGPSRNWEYLSPWPRLRESLLEETSLTENVEAVTSPHTPLRHCCCYWEALFTRPTFLRKNLSFKLPHPFHLCSFWVRTKSFVSPRSWDPIWRVLRRISCVLCEDFMRICGVCAFLCCSFIFLVFPYAISTLKERENEE